VSVTTPGPCLTDRCPRTSTVALAPLTALLLFMVTTLWADQFWIEASYAGPTDLILDGLLAITGPMVLLCAAMRSRSMGADRWGRALRIEKRTLLIIVPLVLYSLAAIAGGAVI